MKAVQLIVLDEVVYSNVKKYIWYGNSPEQKKDGEELFRYLLQNKIYVEGFATDCKDIVGTDKFCKPIVDICDLEGTESKVFIVKEYAGMSNDLMQTIYRVNPMLKANQVVIWGTGSNGETAYRMLTESGVKVRCFIDKNSKFGSGEEMNGVPICGLEELDRLDEGGGVLIEAYEKYYEMDRMIEEKYSNIKEKFYCDVNSLQIFYREPNNEKGLFDFMSGQFELNKLKDKKVIIYGTGADAIELSQYLELLDMNVKAYICEDGKENSENDTRGKQVIPVEEILYENNYAIWVLCDEMERAQKRLKELGVCFCLDVVMPRKQLLMMDINMGHIYSLEGENYAGMAVYGQERQRNYKIAILGGSTTDGTIERYKCWPHFLYELLQRNDITIYNAGVSGYVSGGELIRLIRDILPMKPDMVIVYDGVNDSISQQCRETPYAFYYAQTIYRFGAKHMENRYSEKYKEEIPIHDGIKFNNSRFDNWLSNMETMEAVCHSRNIDFYSFLQPMLLSKRNYNDAEKKMSEKYEGEFSYMAGFRKLIKDYSVEESHHYFCDLSHIFDEVHDVYVDYCHVYESGNEIIASEIYKRISDEINAWERKSYL